MQKEWKEDSPLHILGIHFACPKKITRMNTIKYEKLQEKKTRSLHGWLENAKKENTHSSSNAFLDGFFLA